MLTDIFLNRYLDVPLWEEFGRRESRLLVQCFRIVSEQVLPYYKDKKPRTGAPELWSNLNKTLAMELGLKELSPSVYGFYNVQKQWISGSWPPITVCENFMCAEYDGSISPDEFVKERISFIELAFRHRGEQVAAVNANQEQGILDAKRVRGDFAARLANKSRRPPDENKLKRDQAEAADQVRMGIQLENQIFDAYCHELNTRLRQAGTNLDYHNGFIQISADDATQAEIETPFWGLVSDPMWANVDHDMKEAIDLRDSGGRDPSWYAAKALESTIKIISDNKGWTRGNEKGAINYIDNLRSKANSEFINAWERESMAEYFSKVRNPFGHGPGSDKMPSLSSPQTDWAIEFSMIWIRNLIRRLR